ncbi:PE-PPE domain-containing protein [Mycobacterium sp. B14F4]|uniref:PE-PPE domain-containing protein n=1 Tax=Mycobacterium sp. B14F4 TaxID=3153565 RepID=UPI00325DDB6A
MRVVIRSMVAAGLSLLATVVLAVAWTAATAVQLAATALIMGGTFHPLSTPPDDPVSYVNPYLENAVKGFIQPAAAVPSGTGHPAIATVGDADPWLAVITPEEFFPIWGSRTFDRSVRDGLENLSSCMRGTGCVVNDDEQIVPQPPGVPPAADDEFVVFAYSQSAVIASLAKRDLIENPGETPTVASFFLLANPMRPNGGILARGPQGLTIPIIGVTFYGATPTDSCDVGPCMPTVDVAPQYDPFGGDAPASLTNLLAIINAVAGYAFLHGEAQNATFGDAVYQGSYGDTDYYLYPTKRLPMLMPFGAIVPSPILTALNAPLKAAIEGAYRRDVNPGVVTAVSLLPFHDPIRTILNIIAAIPTGIDDALAEATGDPAFRPLGTAPVTSPYGVGGPDLPPPPKEAVDALTLQSAPAGRTDDAADEAESDAADALADSAEDGLGDGEEVVGEEVVGDGDEPEQPTVRGPIEFDSAEQGDEPASDQADAAETTAGEPEPEDDAAESSDDAEGSESRDAA